MLSQLARDIREKITDFVTGVLTLTELQDWLAPIVWDIEDSGDAVAEELAYSVELAISEYSAGHRTEPDFHREMEKIVLYEPEARSFTSTVSDRPFTLELTADDSSREVEYL